MVRNLTLLTDLYEYTMANGFYQELPQTRATFDIFFRRVPDDGSFVIAAGLAQVVAALNELHFDDADIDYLRQLQLYEPKFLTYLAHFQLACEISAVPEGTPVFPREPLLTITGPLVQAQMLETLLLNILNHQSLIATKSRRICYAAAQRPVMEFGARRAQGPDSAVYGARAAVIGGCVSTSNVLAAQQFGIPSAGTMAHSWVEAFDDELTAFRKWAELYPDNSALLVDTYDVLQSGIPNAIQVFKELVAQGHQPVGIRIDSGDIAYLTKRARQLLDAAGFKKAKITVSNALDENVITALLHEQAPIDNFGIGEKLITSASAPVLSGVYKLAAVQNGATIVPKIKVSGSREKVTLPGQKQTYRLFDPTTQLAFADVIALKDELLDGQPIQVVNSDPLSVGKVTTITHYQAQALQQPVQLTEFKTPDVFQIQAECRRQLAALPSETQRLTNPDRYMVYMTKSLADLQYELLEAKLSTM